MSVPYSDLLPLLLLGVVCVVCIYLWSVSQWRWWYYWRRRGVPCLKPVLPIVGNMYDLLLLKSLPDISNRIYKVTKGLPYVGIYACHTPVLYVQDLDLIARITVRTGDFSRSRLSPCFNIARVKSMLPAMLEKSANLVGKFKNYLTHKDLIEVWDVSLRYSTDVLTLCTIGVDAQCLDDRHEFRKISKQMLGIHFIYHVFTGCFFPTVHKLLGTPVAKASVTEFFHHVIQQIIDHRKEKKNENKDVLQALIDLKEEFTTRETGANIPGKIV
ncbi:cytochrome P450 6B1-like [Homalodisca vitripennis]|uniref:cytochrome P450 6B1-like n=1 Tax=Homalodisca vitripennis TaxID=197043 RepID=UPI001EEBBC4B|nr:cytochrome P450 6B1-like [Homalodisca vitripennis]